VLRQDAILHQANDAVLRILIKFSWHVPDFPIYSNGTKPGTLHIQSLLFQITSFLWPGVVSFQVWCR
ncbi:hypothetical protein ACL1IV_13580, partial [Corynebacterium striatum]